MSFFWTTPGWNGTEWYTAATVDALVDTWKCTVVRLAFDTQNGWNDLCVPVLKRCIEKGIYVIIDWHSHNAEQQRDAAINFFKEQARLYKNTPNVIFEPYNEPKWAGGAQPEVGDVANAQKTWAAIKPYLKDVTKAIRAEGAENLVILGTPYYAQFVQVAADDPVMDDGNKPFTNVAYSFHFYAASHGNGAYYYSHPDANGQKSGGMEPSYLAAAIGSVPIFITEWGTTHSDGGEGRRNTYIDETNTDWWFDTYVDKYHFSHCNWSATSFQPSSAFNGNAQTPSQSGAIAKKHIAVSTVDHWELPSTSGKIGPAVDSVFTMPGTHPTAGYNRYFDGSVSAINIPFLLRDTKDFIRTSANKAVSIAGGAKSDEFVEYWVKSSSETKYLLLRYLAIKGTGTLDVMIDGTSKGTLTLTSTPDSNWATKIVPVTIGAGDHKIRLRVSAASGEGFMIEWLELTDSSTATIKNFSLQNHSYEPKIIRQTNGFIIQLPDAKRFTHYTIFGIDGRAACSAPLSANENKLSVTNLTKGTWFLRLGNTTKNETYKLVF